MDPSSKHKLLLRSKLLAKTKKQKQKPRIDLDSTSVVPAKVDEKTVITTGSIAIPKPVAASGAGASPIKDTVATEETSVKDMFYNYEPDTITDLTTLSSIKNREVMYICVYRVNTTSKKPFLEFCLHKDSRDVLSFPFLKHKSGKEPSIEGSDFIKTIFGSKSTISFYIRRRENENYLFYEIKDYTYKPKFMLKKTQWWWSLITEMVNYKKLMNFNISTMITDLFLEHPSLLYLTNRDNIPIEIPGVGFHGTYFDILNFIMSYGLRPSTLLSMMGPYYYFGTFRKAVRYAGWTSNYSTREIDGKIIADSKGRYKKGGIARFAVFLGKTKAFLNHPTEKDDFSDIVKERIRENPRDERWEKLILKLHDHNGEWAKEYDSAYIGRVRLSNGGLFMKNPEFITKHNDQNLLLSTHELDQKTLKDKWDGNYTRYNIK